MVFWFDLEDEYEGLSGGYRYDAETKTITDPDGDQIKWRELTVEAAEALEKAGLAAWFTGDMKGEVIAEPTYEDVARELNDIEIPENRPLQFEL